MGAIIFEGNFMVRGQLSGGHFSLEAIFLGGNCLGAIIRGVGQSSSGQSSSGQVSGGGRAIFLGDSCPEFCC